MMYKSHVLMGVITTIIPCDTFKINLSEVTIPALAGSILGSMGPDLDNPNSFMGRIPGINKISRWIERKYGRRTITHSYFGIGVWFTLGLLAMWLIPSMNTNAFVISYMTGYIMHVILDIFNQQGVALTWFFGSSSFYAFPVDPVERIYTNSREERWLQAGLFIGMLLVSPVWLTGSLEAACFSIFHKARFLPAYSEAIIKMNTLLVQGSGTWNESGMPFSAQMEVVEITDDRDSVVVRMCDTDRYYRARCKGHIGTTSLRLDKCVVLSIIKRAESVDRIVRNHDTLWGSDFKGEGWVEGNITVTRDSTLARMLISEFTPEEASYVRSSMTSASTITLQLHKVPVRVLRKYLPAYVVGGNMQYLSGV